MPGKYLGITLLQNCQLIAVSHMNDHNKHDRAKTRSVWRDPGAQQECTNRKTLIGSLCLCLILRHLHVIDPIKVTNTH